MKADRDRSSVFGIVARVLWPTGWALLLVLSTCVTYVVLVIGGK